MLHGKMTQEKRMDMFTQFNRKEHCVLFTTDVGARGLGEYSELFLLQFASLYEIKKKSCSLVSDFNMVQDYWYFLLHISISDQINGSLTYILKVYNHKQIFLKSFPEFSWKLYLHFLYNTAFVWIILTRLNVAQYSIRVLLQTSWKWSG